MAAVKRQIVQLTCQGETKELLVRVDGKIHEDRPSIADLFELDEGKTVRVKTSMHGREVGCTEWLENTTMYTVE
eukprot:6461000-Amphidinium_carterae.1